MRTIRISSVVLPRRRVPDRDRHRDGAAVRRLAGARRRPHRSACSWRSSDTSSSSSTRSSSSRSCTARSSRPWRRSRRPSGCSRPSPRWSTVRAQRICRRSRGAIELRDVTFGYLDEPVLRDVDLVIRRRRDRRARRPDRRGQVDPGEADRAVLRPGSRRRADRRARPARRSRRARCARSSASSRRRGSCSAAPSPRTCGSPARRHRRRSCATRAPRSGRWSSSRRCRTGSTRRSRSAARACRPASASCSRSPVRWSPTRRC